jgi:hypothetical protein
MSLLNRENDGMHSILLTLASTLADQANKPVPRDDLIALCIPHASFFDEGPMVRRVQATLRRWIDLGLFIEENGNIRLAVTLEKKESADSFCERLPTLCRLALDPNNGNPLWRNDGEKDTGPTADLCRSLAWCLAQNIYTPLPSSWNELEPLTNAQVEAGKFIFQNDTRWQGFKPWARFMGLATGSDRLFFDPTVAVHSELGEVFGGYSELPADAFMDALAQHLPVLDGGCYYREVTQALRPEQWSPPDPGCLSTALSFAIQCLTQQGVLRLETKADAGVRKTLVRQGGRIREQFTHIRLGG